MRLTTSQIKDINGADIWVMDPNVQFVNDIKPMSENDLYRVRSVPGVRLGRAAVQGPYPGPVAGRQISASDHDRLDDATLVGSSATNRDGETWRFAASPMR